MAARKASAAGARTAGASRGRSPRARSLTRMAAGGAEAKRAFDAMMTMKKIDVADHRGRAAGLNGRRYRFERDCDGQKRTAACPTGRETRAGFLSSDVETPDTPDYVVVELRYESPVAFTASKFVAPAAGERQAETLNNVLGNTTSGRCAPALRFRRRPSRPGSTSRRRCRRNRSQRSSRRRA